jgi:hypothetical protein
LKKGKEEYSSKQKKESRCCNSSLESCIEKFPWNAIRLLMVRDVVIDCGFGVEYRCIITASDVAPLAKTLDEAGRTFTNASIILQL